MNLIIFSIILFSFKLTTASTAIASEIDAELVNVKSALVRAYKLPQLADLPSHRDILALEGYSIRSAKEEGKNSKPTAGDAAKDRKIAALMHLIYVLQEQMIRSPVREPLSLIVFKEIFTSFTTDEDLNLIFTVTESFDPVNSEFYRFVLKALFKAGEYDVFLKLFRRLYVQPVMREFPLQSFHDIFGDFEGYSGAIKNLFGTQNALFLQFVNLTCRNGWIKLLNGKFIEGIVRAERDGMRSWIADNVNRFGDILDILKVIFKITSDEDGAQAKLKSLAKTLAMMEQHPIIRSKLLLSIDVRYVLNSNYNWRDLRDDSNVELSLIALQLRRNYSTASELLRGSPNQRDLLGLHFDPKFHAELIKDYLEYYKRWYPSQPPDDMFTYELRPLLGYFNEKDLRGLIGRFSKGGVTNNVPALRIIETVLQFGSTNDFKDVVMSVVKHADIPNAVKTVLKMKATDPNLSTYLLHIKDKLKEAKVRIPNLASIISGAEPVETLVASGILSFTGGDFLALLSKDDFYQAFTRHRDLLTITQTGPLPAPGNETEITRAASFPDQLRSLANTPLSQFPCAGRFEANLFGRHLSTIYRRQQLIKLRFRFEGVPERRISKSAPINCEEEGTVRMFREFGHISGLRLKERFAAASEKCTA